MRPPVEILHHDPRLVIVNKPSGIIVHRGWAQDDDDLLRTVRDMVGRYVYPLHRLDRGASGAVAFALDADTARELGQAFASGTVEKRYLAIVRGHPPETSVIDHPLAPEPGAPPQEAVTRVRRLMLFERYAVVEAIPETGRRHQIRRHLKHLSCPLIGDVKYGKGEHNRHFRERFGLHRLALHALHLALPGGVVAKAPIHGELSTCLHSLGWEREA